MGLYLGRQKIENLGETFGLSVALSNYIEGTRSSYIAVQEKGGTLPQEQTIGNLPESIRTIPSGITPAGSITFTDNGTYDVTQKASAVVNVQKGVFPSGTLNITQNGTYDVTQKLSASVNVQGIVPTGKKIIINTNETDVAAYATAQVQDSNLVASNIKKNVSILGINGIYEGGAGIYNEVPSYQVDANGNATRRGGNLDGKFDNIRNIGEYVMYNCFYSCSNLSSVSFPSLISIGSNGMQYCFEDCSNLSSISFPSLTSIGLSGMSYCFRYCSKLSSASFPSLTSIGERGMYYCFDGCIKLSSVFFPSLTSVGTDGMYYCFRYCSKLSSASFPSLTSIGTNGMSYCFSSCYNLSSVFFPSLTSVGLYGMFRCFQFCSNLSSVSFPELKTLLATNSLDSLGSYSLLKEIHFRSDMQTAVEAQSQYSSKFGATNATIYFDL